MWDLFPDQELKPVPSALGVWGLNHWTTREVPPSPKYHFLCILLHTHFLKIEKHIFFKQLLYTLLCKNNIYNLRFLFVDEIILNAFFKQKHLLKDFKKF